MKDAIVPLDFSNVEGETAEQFVERNRKAVMVEIFRRAMTGDRSCMEIVGKIVSAPLIQKSRVLALGGNTVAFEGIAGTPGLDQLLESMKRGMIKTDSLKIPNEGSLKLQEAKTYVEVHSGNHEVAAEDKFRRHTAAVEAKGGGVYYAPAPEILEMEGE
jgi:hypothetical protein